ncbi:MAG: Asp-tRNA(Asn)/Glu-tRNA(Gln) amidotransferase subunit GatC [Deferrisomatales bacterium]|nr:Asp-tRNA(Asn)/Glu-tRNA(Gln) amidotransferase subunit GatC [Deferrisomatales bacterium]
MKIGKDEVLRVASLARLTFADEEVGALAEQLSCVLDYVDKLGELDLEGVEPMAHVLERETPLREDCVRPSLPQRAALANAPAVEQGCFRVPKVIEA